MATLYGLRPGDRVTITTPHGQQCSGRVVLAFGGHVVLNAGGRHGTPKVATAGNIAAVRRAKREGAR